MFRSNKDQASLNHTITTRVVQCVYLCPPEVSLLSHEPQFKQSSLLNLFVTPRFKYAAKVLQMCHVQKKMGQVPTGNQYVYRQMAAAAFPMYRPANQHNV